MAIEIVMPRLGWTMQEGIFGEWLKQDGEEVKSGDLLFTVESDKATQEVENFDNGILRIPPDGPKSGDVIPVGGRLGYIVQPGEAVPFETEQLSQTKQHSPEAAPAPSSQASRAGQSPTRAVAEKDGDRMPAISPRARRVAAELGVEWTQLVGSGRTGRIVERDIRVAYEQQSAAQVPAVPETRIAAKVSPVAQRMAQATGVDLAEVAAQKPGQRIQRQDIEAAIAARAEAPATALQDAGGETIPVSRVRSLIAQRMTESAHTTAAVTLTTEADATEFVALREQLKASHAPRNLLVPSYNDLLIKLTSVALQEYPLLNASWREQEIFIPAHVHMGLAVDT